MTRVRIEPNREQGLQQHLPVEIRRLDLALIERGLSSRQFDLNEGSYFVTSTLPDGRKLFGYGQVSGASTLIRLSLDPDYEVEFTPRDTDIEAQFDVRQLRGNIFTGEIVQEPVRVSNPFWFKVKGNTSTSIVQVLQPGIAPLNILIPAFASEVCEVLIRPTTEGPIRFEIRLEDPASNLLLQYLANGYAREAATLADLNYGRIDFTEHGQSWQLLVLYTLLRFGELWELAPMLSDNGKWYQGKLTSPDSSVIRGEILARLGRHHEAFAAFLELESRGVPVFTDGLYYATQRLQIYREALEIGSLKDELSAYAILRRLRRIATYQTSAYPILAYTGFDLTEPDAVPYSYGVVYKGRLFDTREVSLAEIEASVGATLSNVLPLSIGLETLGGVFTRIFERETVLPASKSEIFTTAEDNQPSVEVNVLQGERPMAADNRSLGKFVLSGIPPMPRGIPRIEVLFEIDANGVITVYAKDLESGNVQHRILTASDLSTAEVNQLTHEAESDLEKLKLAESRILIQSLISQVRNAPRNYNLGPPAIYSAEEAIALAENVAQSDDGVGVAIRILNHALERLSKQTPIVQFEEKAEGLSAGADNADVDAGAES